MCLHDLVKSCNQCSVKMHTCTCICTPVCAMGIAIVITVIAVTSEGLKFQYCMFSTGSTILTYEVQIGWGKAVPLPPTPFYVAPSDQEETKTATMPESFTGQ